MNNENTNKKRTTLLTGFLGAGKTTYLNHVLKSNPTVRYAIIENEFGEQSIDGDLIIRTTDNMVELNNGCLCCSLNDGLYELLNDLYKRKDEFDELIIEATGIADPSGIAEPFINHPAVKETFDLVHTICLIDAEQIEERLQDTEEARLQIAFSDVLLIGKTDLVSESYIKDLTEILKGINPLAQIVVKENDTYPSIFPNSSVDNLSQDLNKPSYNHQHHEKSKHTHVGKSISTHQHTNIVTHSFVFDPSFNYEDLYHQLLILITYQSKDIYRFKGIAYTDNYTKKVLIQSVGKRMGIEELPLTEDESYQSKFVFIGKNIKPDGFRKLLERCINKTQESTDIKR